MPAIKNSLGAVGQPLGAANATASAPNGARVHLPGATTQNCELAVIGTDEVLHAAIKLEPGPPSERERQWNLLARTSLSESAIATFLLKDQWLSFEWTSAATASAHDTLRYCLLLVQVDGKREVCHLNEPVKADPATLDFKKGVNRFEPDFTVPESLAALLRLDVVPSGFPAHTLESGRGLGMRDTAVMKMPQPDCVELEISFDVERNRLSLQSQAHISYKRLTKIRKATIDADSFKFEDERKPLTFSGLQAMADPADFKLLARKQKTLESKSEAAENVLDNYGITVSRAPSSSSQSSPSSQTQSSSPSQSFSSSSRYSSSSARTPQDQLMINQAQGTWDLSQSLGHLAQEARRQLDENQNTMRDVRSLCESLETNARIGYRAYIVVGGERVVLLDATGSP